MESTVRKGLRQLGSPQTPANKKAVGLTGNPGSGKSTAAKYLESYGARIISGDELGYSMLEKTSPVFDDLISAFGNSILNDDGSIDRRTLGQIVFSNQNLLDQLNAIVHPAMISELKRMIETFHQSDEQGPLVIDAALIYEWEIEDLFDGIVVVAAPESIRRERFHTKRGQGVYFDQREAAQLPENYKCKKADVVIHNNSNLDHLQSQINVFMQN